MRNALILALLLSASSSLVVADPIQVALRPVTTGLSQPTAITNAGDSRLFITLQPGYVVIWDGTRILPTPFLDIHNLVSSGEEQGILSIAFDPHYASNGFFYVDFTDVAGDTNVARYRVLATDPDVADPASRQLLLKVGQPYPNHNGGQLQFGPDGYLYIGMGDGGDGGDPGDRAQNNAQLLGKLLRIDISDTQSGTYAIPPSNPFASGVNGAREIWAYGLRNPWRFSFDRATGDLWIADVGQSAWEEVDLQAAGSVGGQNYGWRKMEATHCYNPSTNCRDASMTLPILEYSHGSNRCSITGGYRYRGSRYPRLVGTYFYADYCTGEIFGATQAGDGSWTSTLLVSRGTIGNVTTFGEGVDGELYVAGQQNGSLMQITDPNPIVRRRVAKQ